MSIMSWPLTVADLPKTISLVKSTSSLRDANCDAVFVDRSVRVALMAAVFADRSVRVVRMAAVLAAVLADRSVTVAEMQVQSLECYQTQER